jgi:hypothetical protein
MLERINERLSAEGIPAVEIIILKWRMSQLLRDIQRKYSTSWALFLMCGPWQISKLTSIYLELILWKT